MIGHIELLGRLLLAALLGSVVGLERERLTGPRACARTCWCASAPRS